MWDVCGGRFVDGGLEVDGGRGMEKAWFEGERLGGC